MRLLLEKRSEHSQLMTVISPLIAVALTLVTGGFMFLAMGLNPFEALYVYFLEPLKFFWKRGGRFFVRPLTWMETTVFCRLADTPLPN